MEINRWVSGLPVLIGFGSNLEGGVWNGKLGAAAAFDGAAAVDTQGESDVDGEDQAEIPDGQRCIPVVHPFDEIGAVDLDANTGDHDGDNFRCRKSDGGARVHHPADKGTRFGKPEANSDHGGQKIEELQVQKNNQVIYCRLF